VYLIGLVIDELDCIGNDSHIVTPSALASEGLMRNEL
jgi:hypothetical protein